MSGKSGNTESTDLLGDVTVYCGVSFIHWWLLTFKLCRVLPFYHKWSVGKKLHVKPHKRFHVSLHSLRLELYLLLKHWKWDDPVIQIWRYFLWSLFYHLSKLGQNNMIEHNEEISDPMCYSTYINIKEGFLINTALRSVFFFFFKFLVSPSKMHNLAKNT